MKIKTYLQPNNFIKKSLSFLLLMPLLTITACQHETSNTANNEINTLSNLNDTGTILYTQDFNPRLVNDPKPIALTNSPDTNAPGQDADKGKDADPDNSNNDGTAGFKFTKLDANGNPLESQASSYSIQAWQCIKDETTGLTWEVKTPTGLQAFSSTYTWYNTDFKLNGGNVGAINESKTCNDLENCNTSAYINAIKSMNNEKGLCGSKKWRLPLREELRSLIDYSVSSGPMIDTNFFPNTYSEDTWTSQTAFYRSESEDGSQAWEIHFNIGKSESHDKASTSVAVRLVH